MGKSKNIETQIKYDLYIKAVQSPETDVRFYQDRYHSIRGRSKKNLTLREDFCGTGIISTEWVKLNKNYSSFGVDLDPEPIKYGQENFLSQLTSSQKQRIFLLQKNVLAADIPTVDIIAAVNFSYFLFKDRVQLKKYYERVFQTLNMNGLAIFDIFGGTQCTDTITDRYKHKTFTYYWEQKNYDPITQFADFAIHFKNKNKMYKNVFTYDWRMWGIAEVSDILKEVGFKEIKIFWEGTNRKGAGNGIFTETKKGEPCLSWIAYVVALK